jgi:glycosyltransferase involved in cell wall biosynthesis
VLLLTTRIPFPPIGGDKIRSNFFIERLARHYDVHLVSLSDRPLDAPAAAYLRRHCARYDVFPMPRWRHLLNVLLAVFGSSPLQIAYYYFPAIARFVLSLEPDVDFAVPIGQRAAKYFFGFSKPCFLEMTDSQTLICRHGARHDRSWMWRLIHRLEAPRIEAFERDCVSRFQATLFVNRREEAFYERPDRTHWLPNGVNEELLHRERAIPAERACCFLGRLDTQPNADAVVWFGANVLPLLPADILWYVIGPAAGPRIKNLAARFPNVRLTGFLDDPWSLLARCACMVAPMQTGGGSQYKILEGMAMGVPVVTTQHGAAPIEGGRPPVHFLVTDDPREMAAAVQELVSNPPRASAIGLEGRKLIESRYTWDVLETKLLEVIEAERPATGNAPARA